MQVLRKAQVAARSAATYVLCSRFIKIKNLLETAIDAKA